MPQIEPRSLLSLEAYARERNAYRARVIAHKKLRTLHLGEHVTLVFEDEQTIRYQVQEMLRIERIFEEEGIRGELEAYNPLIPDGSNLKATVMLEYAEREERALRLAQLRGFERECWMRVAGFEPVRAISDEDLSREDDSKTAAVHFARFEFTPPMIRALHDGAALSAGVSHPAYRHSVEPVPATLRRALLADFD